MSFAFKTSVPEKYKKGDMKLAATFRSSEKQPSLRVLLEPTLEDRGPNNEVTKKQGTGLMIRFTGTQFSTDNKKLVELLLASKFFNAPKSGFHIDENDPTGFWRAVGAVEEVPVKTHKATGLSLKDGGIDLRKLNKFADEAPPPLVDVRTG